MFDDSPTAAAGGDEYIGPVVPTAAPSPVKPCIPSLVGRCGCTLGSAEDDDDDEEEDDEDDEDDGRMGAIDPCIM